MMSIVYFKMLQPKKANDANINGQRLIIFKSRNWEWTNTGNSYTAILLTSLQEMGISMFIMLFTALKKKYV